MPFTPTDTPGAPGSPGPGPPVPGPPPPPGPEPPPSPGPGVGRAEPPVGGDAAGRTRNGHLGNLRHAHADRARAAAACHSARLYGGHARTPATRAIALRRDHDTRVERRSVEGSETAGATAGAPATCRQRARESATRPPARAMTATTSRDLRTAAGERRWRRRRPARPPRALRPAASSRQRSHHLAARLRPRSASRANPFESTWHASVAPCHHFEQFVPPGGVICHARRAIRLRVRVATMRPAGWGSRP